MYFRINQPDKALLPRFPSGCAETAKGRVHINEAVGVICQLLKVHHALLHLVPPRLRWKLNGSSSQQNNSKRYSFYSSRLQDVMGFCYYLL